MRWPTSESNPLVSQNSCDTTNPSPQLLPRYSLQLVVKYQLNRDTHTLSKESLDTPTYNLTSNLFFAAVSRGSQNPWMPETKTGIKYFKHVTKHFLTPYDKTHGILTSKEILDKLFHWNCEWLTRPNYVISELADTLYSNLATLAEYTDKVFTRYAIDTLLNKARPIRTVLQRFNKKDSATAEEPDKRDLATLMKFIEDDKNAKNPIEALICSIGSYACTP